jgi:hypothetical protein
VDPSFPELDTERGAQSRAEQSRASQAREQCPFGVIPFLAIARTRDAVCTPLLASTRSPSSSPPLGLVRLFACWVVR